MTLKFESTVFKNRSLMTVVALGAALGYGNILDFPLMVGKHGGSAFLLVFVLCQLLIAVPVMLSEFLLGRRSQSDALSGWERLSVRGAFGSGWKYLGWTMVIAGMLTLAAYSVIFSWSAVYLQSILMNSVTQQTDYVRFFLAVIQQPESIVGYQIIFFMLLASILMVGMRKGLIISMLFLVPLTLLVLIVLLVVSTSKDSFLQSLDFVFGWRWHELTLDSFYMAIDQAFFSLGIGVGALWYCGSIADKKVSIGKVALLVMLFDLMASLIVALTIWQLDVAVSGSLWSGTELLFQQLPMLLGQRDISLFFIAMILTGVTSALLIVESLITALESRYPINRVSAALSIALIALLFGAAGQFSFNYGSELLWYGRTIFENYVMFSSGIFVPASGALLAFFVGWVMRSSDAKDEWQPTKLWRFWAWRWSLRIISIIAIMLVFFAALEQHLNLSYQGSLLMLATIIVMLFGIKRLISDARY